MARTPALTRDSIAEDQRAAFDELVQLRGEVPASGPGSVMLNAPEVAKRALELAGFLRGESSSLERRIRELAMLAGTSPRWCTSSSKAPLWSSAMLSLVRAGVRARLNSPLLAASPNSDLPGSVHPGQPSSVSRAAFVRLKVAQHGAIRAISRRSCQYRRVQSGRGPTPLA